jgi:hypothetical protein
MQAGIASIHHSRSGGARLILPFCHPLSIQFIPALIMVHAPIMLQVHITLQADMGSCPLQPEPAKAGLMFVRLPWRRTLYAFLDAGREEILGWAFCVIL